MRDSSHSVSRAGVDHDAVLTGEFNGIGIDADLSLLPHQILISP